MPIQKPMASRGSFWARIRMRALAALLPLLGLLWLVLELIERRRGDQDDHRRPGEPWR